ncbi:transcriptional regulator (plasmid) [Vibrio sp. HDW18]|uniref:HlyU family transcriptional regulator n=1 Tax=Vibrio sp. HDW18 TaxID=2714948 RepID=UPI00140B6761|nr:HlyU family transcriptional regulator [Vibrio sp. HDW18]QIL87000.1 transcriptional regulator [Vibrio sp. HDW18]
MGLFARIFGKMKQAELPEIEPIEYQGFLIYPEPMAENGQFRVAGRITQELQGELKTHRFIRSDLVASKADAEELMLKKAQLFIDQMSGQIFS